MKQWLPVVKGFFGGLAIGLCLLFQGDSVTAVSEFLQEFRSPATDPEAVCVLAVPVTVLSCALIGTLVGCVISLSRMAIRWMNSPQYQIRHDDP
jgi:hypothetical protein